VKTSRTRWAWSATLVLLACVAGRPAAAQSGDPRYDPAWHGGIAAATVLGSALFVVAGQGDVPTCRWCGVGEDASPRVPRMDAWARARWRWTDERRAGTLSHVTAGASYAWPLMALSAVHGGTDGEWGRDQVVALGSILVSRFASDVAKRTTRRARPNIVFDQEPVDAGDDVRSFFSGHAATTFAAAVSTGTIASRRNSSDAGWIWAGGLGLATSTAYLRVAADRHFLTDVLVGAAAGAAIGLVLPWVFDAADQADEAAEPTLVPMVGIGPAVQVGLRHTPTASLQVGAGGGRLGVVATITSR